MFKLSPTSVVQGRAPATTSYVHHCQTGKNLQRCFVDMGMDLVDPAFPPPPPLPFTYFSDQSEANIRPRKIEAGPPGHLGK